jgi:D-alanyl-lipoteichoic acid acyltransferase DltB (MBOAT superfamily)
VVTSLEFLVALLLGSAFYPFLPGVKLRQAFLGAANLFVLYTMIPNAASWVALGVFLGSGYVAGTWLRAKPGRAGFSAYLVLLLAAFIVLKKYGFLAYIAESLLAHPISIVGLSYMLFRQIHFVVDAMQGQFERVSAWDYANYQVNLFAIFAGPIQRYQDFCKSWHALRLEGLDRHDLLKIYMRIMLGVIKAAGLGAAFLFAYDKFYGRLVDAYKAPGSIGIAAAVVQFVAVLYLYPLYMYCNFSGYCDIVIGGGALFGLRLPENFDRPYLSRNILDFWTRWHQTLGFWIRDYLFMPMYKAIAERTPQNAPSLAFLCYFIAFLLAGIWHGSTSNFLIFGLLHGLGASAAKLWEMYLVKCHGRKYLKEYLQARITRIVAVTATLHYVGLTMLFFPHDLAGCLVPLRVLYSAVVSRITG